MADLFGVDMLFDPQDVGKLVLRLALNLVFVFLLLRGVYYRHNPRRDFAFSCVMLNVITFSICLLLRKVPVDMGFALGLFAVFGILRYRTQPIHVRDLTYLFVLLGIGILNAVANKKISFAELVLINGVIVAVAALLESYPLGGRRQLHEITYDRLDLLQPHRDSDLREDLRTRLGIEVLSYEVESVDLLRDVAKIRVTSPSNPPEATIGEHGQAPAVHLDQERA